MLKVRDNRWNTLTWILTSQLWKVCNTEIELPYKEKLREDKNNKFVTEYYIMLTFYNNKSINNIISRLWITSSAVQKMRRGRSKGRLAKDNDNS